MPTDTSMRIAAKIIEDNEKEQKDGKPGAMDNRADLRKRIAAAIDLGPQTGQIILNMRDLIKSTELNRPEGFLGLDQDARVRTFKEVLAMLEGHECQQPKAVSKPA